ncbi:site-specific integrase [Paenibacillus sp. p3-SID867]|uniref:site-specific integrase n=1 Tax=Paenibacillus sp. p3-SID867 TaxID=2916363 RepID=UPI0021A4D99B|nr:site-specific integrase [Paenibacillus sp. p3-SID867]MCT1400039.1 site-specific integrase [Paenibacillus sp. p3-SID867]
MAGSFQKIGKKYRVTLELGFDATGKRMRKYQTVNTEKEAKKILNDFNYNQQRNLLVHTPKISMEQFLVHWMDNYVKYNCEVTTEYGYRNIVKHIVQYMGKVELEKLRPDHIQQYYKHLMDDKSLSPNTVHKHHAIIRKALDYGLKQQYVYRNIADAVVLPRKLKFEGQSYTKEQLKVLLAAAKGTKLEVPIYLAGLLGLRREEIVGLKWKYVDLENRCLHIHEVRTSAGKETIVKAPKTEKSRRTLYIDDDLYEILIAHQSVQSEWRQRLGNAYIDTDYVYTKEDGRPYRVNSVTEQFSAFLAKKKLPKIRLHDLRHTWCSILYNEGVSLKSISEAMGHSEIGTTSKIYAHSFDKIHKNAVSVISKVIKE